jgi:hypothetical protein
MNKDMIEYKIKIKKSTKLDMPTDKIQFKTHRI